MLTNDHLLQAFEAAGATAGVLYLSAPITSGLREIRLMQELGVSSEILRSRFSDRWKAEVMRPNEETAASAAEKLRLRAKGLIVIDPSRMAVTGWSQVDYNGFWLDLMRKYVRKMTVASDWEFSKGARGEVSFALALDRPVTTMEGRTLSKHDVQAVDKLARRRLLEQGWNDSQVTAYLPPIDFHANPRVELSPAAQAFDWLVRERSYQVRKFGLATDDEHTKADGLDQSGWWWQQLTNYYGRASLLNLDSLLGRQALAKYVATACGLLESVIRIHGELPPAGLPSGETASAHGGG